MRMRSGSNVRSRFSPYLVAPSGLIRVGEFPRVHPGLSFIGQFGPQIGNVQNTGPSGRMTGANKILPACSGTLRLPEPDFLAFNFPTASTEKFSQLRRVVTRRFGIELEIDLAGLGKDVADQIIEEELPFFRSPDRV
jgi:hypothetical protein